MISKGTNQLILGPYDLGVKQRDPRCARNRTLDSLQPIHV